MTKIMSPLGIPSRKPQKFQKVFASIEGCDEELGVFKYNQLDDSWSCNSEAPVIGTITVTGRSQHPQQEEKHVLQYFLPKLNEFSQLTLVQLDAPHESYDSDILEDLAINRLDIDIAAGIVELYFSPGVDIPDDYVWPLSTFSIEGKLLKTQWIT